MSYIRETTTGTTGGTTGKESKFVVKRSTGYSETHSRRRLLKLGVVALGAWGGNKAYENRVFQPNYDISPRVAEILTPKSEEIQKHIKAGKFEKTEIDGKPYIPIVNLRAIADALTYIAYLDGGMPEVNRVTHFIRNGLEINSMRIEDQKKFRGLMHPPYAENDPILIEITPTALKDFDSDLNEIVFHELYHVVQQGRRNPITKTAVGLFSSLKKTASDLGPILLSAKAGSKVAKRSWKSWKKDSVVSISRRGFLAGSVALVGGATTYAVSSNINKRFIENYKPDENQAYRQGGDPYYGPSALTSKRCFDRLRGTFFFFDQP